MLHSLHERWLVFRRKRQAFDRLREIAPPFAQQLEVMATALRAGGSLQQAIGVVAEDDESPLAIWWQEVLKEVQWGRSLTEALERLDERVSLAPVRSFVTVAIATQEAGGNLAQSLWTLAQTLHQETTFRKKVEALTAQGKISGYVVSAIPFALMAMLGLMAPELMTPLFTTLAGQALIVLILILVTIGSLMIREIVRIEV